MGTFLEGKEVRACGQSRQGNNDGGRGGGAKGCREYVGKGTVWRVLLLFRPLMNVAKKGLLQPKRLLGPQGF